MAFDAKMHGDPILRLLDIPHILARPDECCWLRTIFAWCIGKLGAVDALYDETTGQEFCLDSGCQSAVTRGQ